MKIPVCSLSLSHWQTDKFLPLSGIQSSDVTHRGENLQDKASISKIWFHCNFIRKERKCGKMRPSGNKQKFLSFSIMLGGDSKRFLTSDQVCVHVRLIGAHSIFNPSFLLKYQIQCTQFSTLEFLLEFLYQHLGSPFLSFLLKLSSVIFWAVVCVSLWFHSV